MLALVQSPSEAHASQRCASVTMAPYFVVKATPNTPNEQGERFALEAIDEAVDRLAGRPGIHSVVLPRLRGNRTRVAVACGRGGEWQGRLFIVEVVRP